MRIIKKISDDTRRLTIDEVSVFSSESSSTAAFESAAPPLTEAPYPAFFTALIISESGAVPSTLIEFVSRFTEHDSTPLTPLTAFSTRALQAAQLIPVTLYCFKKSSPNV